jgi:hypothetical protein
MARRTLWPSADHPQGATTGRQTTGRRHRGVLHVTPSLEVTRRYASRKYAPERLCALPVRTPPAVRTSAHTPRTDDAAMPAMATDTA